MLPIRFPVSPDSRGPDPASPPFEARATDTGREKSTSRDDRRPPRPAPDCAGLRHRPGAHGPPRHAGWRTTRAASVSARGPLAPPRQRPQATSLHPPTSAPLATGLPMARVCTTGHAAPTRRRPQANLCGPQVHNAATSGKSHDYSTYFCSTLAALSCLVLG
jgi:hypothetical protein